MVLVINPAAGLVKKIVPVAILWVDQAADPDNFWTTFSQLLDCFRTTFSQLSNSFWTTFSQLSDSFLEYENIATSDNTDIAPHARIYMPYSLAYALLLLVGLEP